MFRAEGGPIGPPSINAELLGTADLVGLHQIRYHLHPEPHHGHGELVGLRFWAEGDLKPPSINTRSGRLVGFAPGYMGSTAP